MKKDIGIITHLYKSTNYGGVLQAFALCEYLNEQGYKTEQIQYEKTDELTLRKRVGNICRALKKCYSKAKHASVYKKIDSRAIKFEEFKKKYICQSRNVYTKNDLDKLPQEYKLFITGSDQVWHPNAVCDAYLLAFGNSEVKRMSYAASVAKDTLTEAELERYSLSFRNYSAISVREKNAVEILQPASPIKIQLVLDPVFLLGRKKWDSLGGDKRIKKKYVFCYFLGESNAQRKAAYEYAQRRECDIFLIGHLNNEYMECDEKIRGENIVDADPLDFVRLIRDAETVFTDSFHAMAFSMIFRKDLFVFERSAKSTMSSRIISLAEMYGIQGRFLNDGYQDSEKLFSIPPIDYEHSEANIEELREESISFLLNNVKNCLEER